ncbi:MAG: 4-alpha-glucanotransferase [Lachnospiraceae bacterium]
MPGGQSVSKRCQCYTNIARIDHFRGFDSYYAIPGKDKTARNGEWRKDRTDLFRTLEEKLGKLNIIVEDLGYLTPSVIQMVKDSGSPGMNVIQFAFDDQRRRRLSAAQLSGTQRGLYWYA